MRFGLPIDILVAGLRDRMLSALGGVALAVCCLRPAGATPEIDGRGDARGRHQNN